MAATASVSSAAAAGSLWPRSAARSDEGQLEFHGISATELLEKYGSPLYVLDTDEVRFRARSFVSDAQSAFKNITTKASFAAKAFISKEIVRIVSEEGMYVDTCSAGEMRIALAAGVPGRRLILHGNNKSDEEIRLAVENDFAKIVLDSPDEPRRVARIARETGKRARVMLRVTVGVHAGGHEYISTSHEDQKFGVALLAAGEDSSALEKSETAVKAIAKGPALSVLKDILSLQDDLELVGIHSHIGSQIHDASAFNEAARRILLLRETLYFTDGFTAPEIDLGGGYSVAYLDSDESMNIKSTFEDIAGTFAKFSREGLPSPAVSFEPGRSIIAPAGVTLYKVGTVKPVALSDGTTRVYVSVDGGMSDNIRPALYDADYTAVLANRANAAESDVIESNVRRDDSDENAQASAEKSAEKSAETCLARVVGMHCESGDIIVKNVYLPADIKRGDILAVPATGAYGRTMASNYNQVPRPAVAAVSSEGSHLMIRRETVEDLLSLDVSQ